MFGIKECISSGTCLKFKTYYILFTLSNLKNDSRENIHFYSILIYITNIFVAYFFILTTVYGSK